MLKKHRFKPYAFIIALAAILILPVLVYSPSSASPDDGSSPSMEKCMRATGGDQAKFAAKIAKYNRSEETSMQSCMRLSGGDQAGWAAAEREKVCSGRGDKKKFYLLTAEDILK